MGLFTRNKTEKPADQLSAAQPKPEVPDEMIAAPPAAEAADALKADAPTTEVKPAKGGKKAKQSKGAKGDAKVDAAAQAALSSFNPEERTRKHEEKVDKESTDAVESAMNLMKAASEGKRIGVFSQSTFAPEAEAPALVTAARPAPSRDERATTTISPERAAYLQNLKKHIHQQLVEKLDVQNMRGLPSDAVRQQVKNLIRELCTSEKGLINLADQERLMDDVMDETFGLGPLETLLKDGSVSDILVNRFDRIYVERKGRLELSEVRFRDNAHLRQIIDRIVGQVGRRVDEISPMVDARLTDGSRVNAIIPPLSLDGPAMSIRRFGSRPLQLEDLIRAGAFPAPVMDFLSSAVQARTNVLISGGTGSGKTTLLNSLSRYIPTDERVITIEDAAELQLQQPHVVRLETRPSNIEGKGEITQRDLVKNCLRMRPDRIIIGEVRGSEALDMLQAMNTGHEGSMTTVHANTTRDALQRLEVMVAMSGYEIPLRAVRQQVASAIHIIVQTSRLTGGRRKVLRVSEITGMEGDTMQMHDLFGFEQSGVDSDGHATGEFVCYGVRPRCTERIEHRGISLPQDLFLRRVMT